MTVDEIAKTAKVGKGTIYYYYTDKTEILCNLKKKQLT
ncbi:TetR/AcrR family transcriptional regulator [Bacillus thuringiensis]